jgi:hypothetical protein
MYKIIGANGQQYGPVDGDQIRQWIAEGRVERETPVFADGAKDWNFVGLLPEFTGLFAGATPPPIAPLPPGTATAGRLPKTNSFALAGLIFGILSVTLFCCCCGFPFSLLGLIFSLTGLSQVKHNPHLYEGRSLAVAGLILSIASLVFSVGWFIFSLLNHQLHFNWSTGQF